VKGVFEEVLDEILYRNEIRRRIKRDCNFIWRENLWSK